MKQDRLSSLAFLNTECDLLREIESTDFIETFFSKITKNEFVFLVIIRNNKKRIVKADIPFFYLCLIIVYL
jgi:hypothetical protein